MCFPHERPSALIGKLKGCDGQRDKEKYETVENVLFIYCISSRICLGSLCLTLTLNPRTHALISECVREAEGVVILITVCNNRSKG